MTAGGEDPADDRPADQPAGGGGVTGAPASADAARAPASATDGAEPAEGMVSVPAAEYAALLEDRRQLRALRDGTDLRRIALERVQAAGRQRFLRPLRSPIEGDQEVAVFLAERFGTVTLEDILTECRSRFGPERTPSRSSAHRFWSRLREAVAGRRGGRR